jgi:transposase
MTRITSKDLQKLVPELRKKGFYTPKKERKINWKAYTTNQINQIIDSLNFIRDEVDKVFIQPKQKTVGRPGIKTNNLVKAILISEMFGLPERESEGIIRLIGHHAGIDEHIDDRVLGRALQKEEVIKLLQKIFENNKTSDGILGGDGTGLEKSRKENYESTKKKNLYMTSIVDSREVVQAYDISGKQECKIMHDLVVYLKQTTKNLLGKLTLDAGFVDRKLTQLIEDVGLTPYIFPKKNLTLKAKKSPAWNKMWTNLVKKTQEWLREYHIRSHTESFHSSLKRVFGIISKKTYKAAYSQLTARIILHNRKRINYFRLIEEI